MEKILEWIKQNKGLVLFIIVILILLPIIVIHFLFKIRTGCYWIEADWESGDILGYFGDVLSFIGTVVLGYVAICQTEKANLLSNEMVKLEWERRKPFLDIIQNQRYEIKFGDEIINYLNEYDFENDMLITPCYIKEKRTGIVTSIAVMKIVVQNIGNSDIRNIFIKTNYCYLSVRGPLEYKECVAYAVEGNTYIKAGEKKNLYIKFEQELDEDNGQIQEQIAWVEDGMHMMPAFDFDLHLVTSDGNEYKENLSCDTSVSRLNHKTNEIVRNLGTINISVDKI